eukprot:gene12223-14313_t
MGCTVSTEQKSSKQIDKELSSEKKTSDREIKLLLLGSGDSGKSTIAKQMRFIHAKGFTDEELKTYRDIMHGNILQCIQLLTRNLERYDLTVAAHLSDKADYYSDINPYELPLASHMVDEIGALWKDESIQKIFETKRNEFNLPEVAQYCLDNIDRIAGDNFVPTQEDVLKCRQRTTGMKETVFTVESVRFRLLDVGGQKNERRKWLHYFDDVKTIIFCVALGDYNMNLIEDSTTNRMHDSIKLWNDIVTNPLFKNTAFVLFLNKNDLFREKITKEPLSNYFPDYTGGLDYDKDQFCQSLGVSSNSLSKAVASMSSDTRNIIVKSPKAMGDKQYRLSGRFDSSTCTFRGIAIDTTDEQTQLRRLKHSLAHDPLTGLKNRYCLNQRIQKFCAKSTTEMCSIFFVDLNKFKAINDTHGHENGDRVLKHLSNQFTLHQDDSLLPIRLSGDEFLIVRRNIQSVEEVNSYIQSYISRVCQQPVLLSDGITSVTLSLSVGGVCFQKSLTQQTCLDQIIKSADSKILYIGSQDAAANQSALVACNIGHVLNVGYGIVNVLQGVDNFKHLNIDIYDDVDYDITQHLPVAFNFINDALQSQSGVLVHCNAGVSRSSTVLIAYLMTTFRLPYDQCHKALKSARPSIQPNQGFLKQLRAYERSLGLV